MGLNKAIERNIGLKGYGLAWYIYGVSKLNRARERVRQR